VELRLGRMMEMVEVPGSKQDAEGLGLLLRVQQSVGCEQYHALAPSSTTTSRLNLFVVAQSTYCIPRTHAGLLPSRTDG
jgi:hypothetical protein